MTKAKARKTVKVSDMIFIAKQEVERFNNFRKNGNLERAKESKHRIMGIIGAISLSFPLDDDDDWQECWDSVYKEIWDLEKGE